MKKCILIGALAALMLFAFTACEQQMPNLPTSETDVLVNKINFVSTDATLREGEKLADKTAVIVDVEYVNAPSKSNVVAATVGDVTTLNGGANLVAVDVNGDGKADGYVQITAAEKTGLRIDTKDVELSVKEADITITPDNSKTKLSGIEVYITYSDSYEKKADSWNSVWNAATASSVTGAKVTADGETAVIEFEVTDKAEPAEVIMTNLYSVTYDADEVIVGQKFDPSKVVVVGSFSDDSRRPLTSDEYYLSTYAFDFDSAKAYTVTVTTYEGKVGVSRSFTMTINAIADYKTGFTASAMKNDDGTQKTTYTKGTSQITVDQFDFYVTSWAVKAISSTASENKIASNEIEIYDTPTTVPAGYVGDTMTVNFRLKADHDVTATAVINLTDPVTT